ncbi:MAG: DNA primase [Gammaproteobacteria bacterium]|nr:DNA primase [Gammaproteobacteria bacterium]
MSGRIPQSFIDDLINRSDIVEVIDTRVPLKKAGREYHACCPFHNEKTPSFTVSPTKQFYHCFGCGAHGTVISFLMEYENLDFIEALKELASNVGMQLPKSEGFSNVTPPVDKSVTQSLYDVMARADQFFQQQLRQHPQAPQAVEYLKQRGLSGEIARDYGIGYSPPGWDNLIKALAPTPPKQLLDAGLVIEKEDNGTFYDRFRERIMFPIRDQRGRVIAFGGRILGDGKPKYLNSPETDLFHKGKELYGLFEARQNLKQIEQIIVVEGYMDVVALAQFGVRNVVATLGTAVTEDHLNQLFRTCSEVIFCFDGDSAGRKAAWRGLENGLPLMQKGRQIRFLFLPDGEDPDTYIRKLGVEAFQQQVDEAQLLSDFLIDQLSNNADLRQVDGQSRFIEKLKPLIQELPAGTYQELLLDRIANKLHLETLRLKQFLGITGTAMAPHYSSRMPRQGRRQPMTPVRRAITLLLQHPSLATMVEEPDKLRSIERPGITLLIDLLESIQQQPQITTPMLLEHWRHREGGEHLMTLIRDDNLFSDDIEMMSHKFRDVINELETVNIQQEYNCLLARFNQLTEAERKRFQELSQLRKVAGQKSL